MHGLPSRRRALGALCALSLVGVGTVLRAQAAGLGRITVAVGARSAQPLRQLPLSVAEQLDFFRLEGLEVTTLDYASDLLALQALKQGVADVAAVGFEHALPTAAVPQGLRSLVLQTRVPQMALAVSSKAAPTHRSVADLRHARVGIADFGSLGHAMAVLALNQAGVEGTEVAFVAVGEGERAQEALRTGQVQALCHSDAVLALLEHQGEVRIVADARGLLGSQAVFGGTLPGTCLLAPAGFVQGRGAQAQALVHGLVHALKWLQTAEPADVVKHVPASGLLAERSLFLAALARARDAMSPDGLMPEDAPRTALRALSVLNPAMAVRQSDLARSYTQEFARKAKQKYSA